MNPSTEASSRPYDAILVVGFGGPERREDVMPFLENVTRGRNVPRGRLLEVAEHYDHFGGVSPLNGQVRDLIAALRSELAAHGVDLPIAWGNRNWHPFLEDAVRGLSEAGVRRALAVVLAGYSSYSSCRQYREDVEHARQAVGEGAPPIDKVRVFYNHPEFIAANADRVRAALDAFPAERRGVVQLVFTAHSIPQAMADRSRYAEQLAEAARLVGEAVGIGPERRSLVYQSRSGRPEDPWLGPDVLDFLDTLAARGGREVLIHPIGFLSDHLEVLYDLDEEARQKADALGLTMVRSATVGTHPRFVGMLRELIQERLGSTTERRAVGRFGPGQDVCPIDCCPAPVRPGTKPPVTGLPESPPASSSGEAG